MTLTILYSPNSPKNAAQRKNASQATMPTLPPLYNAPARTTSLQPGANQLRVARNQMFAEWTDAPQDGDEIAFIPPVSGG